jgi:hypothetical protein
LAGETSRQFLAQQASIFSLSYGIGKFVSVRSLNLAQAWCRWEVLVLGTNHMFQEPRSLTVIAFHE